MCRLGLSCSQCRALCVHIARRRAFFLSRGLNEVGTPWPVRWPAMRMTTGVLALKPQRWEARVAPGPELCENHSMREGGAQWREPRSEVPTPASRADPRLTDDELVRVLRSPESGQDECADAFTELVRRHQGDLRRRLALDPRFAGCDVDSIANDTLLKLFDGQPKYTPDMRRSPVDSERAFRAALRTTARRGTPDSERGETRSINSPAFIEAIESAMESSRSDASPFGRLVLKHLEQLPRQQAHLL